MRKLWTLALIAVASLAIPITFVGCDPAEGPLEEAGEKADQAVEEAGDAVEQATDPS